LIQDGRISSRPYRGNVKKVKVEVDQIIRETGEKASFDAGVHDIHPEIITCWDPLNTAPVIRKMFCSTLWMFLILPGL